MGELQKTSTSAFVRRIDGVAAPKPSASATKRARAHLVAYQHLSRAAEDWKQEGLATYLNAWADNHNRHLSQYREKYGENAVV